VEDETACGAQAIPGNVGGPAARPRSASAMAATVRDGVSRQVPNRRCRDIVARGCRGVLRLGHATTRACRPDLRACASHEKPVARHGRSAARSRCFGEVPCRPADIVTIGAGKSRAASGRVVVKIRMAVAPGASGAADEMIDADLSPASSIASPCAPGTSEREQGRGSGSWGKNAMKVAQPPAQRCVLISA